MDKLLIFTYISILLCSCRQDVTQHGGLRTIDVEDCFETEKEMKLSEIADDIEYLELKTPKEIVVSNISNIISVEDFWLIYTPKGIYKFTKTGDFIKQIGRKGQGPDEYIHILGIDIDFARKEIIQADLQSVLFYDFEGNFLRKVSINDYFYNIALSDSVLWTCGLCTFIDKYMATGLSLDGDTLVVLSNPAYENTKNTDNFYIADLYDFRETSRFGKDLYIQTRTSQDTVYRVSGAKCESALFFDMGKYKLPIEYERWYSIKDYEREGQNYWRISRIDEDALFYYLTAMRQKATNKKRGHKDDVKYIVYDKRAKRGFVTKGLHASKITDDILGGPAFWPRWTTEEYYINTIEWAELSEKIEDEKCALSPVLQKQFENWGEDTNQLIILCRKKSKR